MRGSKRSTREQTVGRILWRFREIKPNYGDARFRGLLTGILARVESCIAVSWVDADAPGLAVAPFIQYAEVKY